VKHLAVILNEKAGAAAGEDSEHLSSRIRSLAAQFGIDARVTAVPGPQIAKAARDALSNSLDAVVAGGGDGTLRSVAEVLAGTSTPLGVLPLGTLNHFAHDLGIPDDLEGAIRVLAEGQTRLVDMGEVNGCYFLNNSSIGAYPRAVAEREATRKQTGHSKPVAMVLAVLKVLSHPPLIHVKLDLDGLLATRNTPFIFVGNNCYEPKLFPGGQWRSCLNAGSLCIFASHCTGFWCVLRLAWQAFRNRLLESKEFDAWTAHSARIKTHKKHLRVALDGELVELESPLLYRIHPGVLKVLAPAAA
jgi:diacylglycerol kinase family enzyme